jgi:hypothetical protein
MRATNKSSVPAPRQPDKGTRKEPHQNRSGPAGAIDLNQRQMKWANVGVGKLYRPFALRLFLLDGQGQPVFTTDAQADPREWLPGEHDVAVSLHPVSPLIAGEYTVAAALVDPNGYRRPLRLAMEVPEKEGRYALSTVKVE